MTEFIIDTGADRHFEIRLALSDHDLCAAQRLRYAVFVEELGGRGGPMVDHAARLERDEYDAECAHLLLIDTRRDPATLDHVVGVYRLLSGAAAARLGRFYSESEYDLTLLLSADRKVLELGRSCVHPDYRGSTAMLHMWNALAQHVLTQDIEILFGVASFHGTDIARLAQPLSWLHHHHLAPPEMRVRALEEHYQPMDLLAADDLSRRDALAQIPPLIKAYLRLGGYVGEGAFVDHDFNTTDVCLIMDTKTMSEKHLDFYTRKSGRG